MKFSTQLPKPSRTVIFSERVVTLAVVTVLTLVSVVLMLLCTSPELDWDEADYAGNIFNTWHFLWSGSEYFRHSHGPMAIYLAKLGHQILPVGSVEVRLRFFEALVGSLAVGLLYWILRRSFRTSRAAALAGSSLLLFSVIRLEETNILGPHDLMLLCTLGIIGLGYQWLDTPTLEAGIVLGVIMGFGAVSMTYVIPAALCWAVAITLSGGKWITWDRTHFKISWFIPVIFGMAAIVALIFWPPGVLQHVILSDFKLLVFNYPSHPTLVGDKIFEVTPRWALVYWLAHLDAPMLAFSIFIILLALWKAFRNGRVSRKHAYLAICLAFFFTTAMVAAIAGARYLLQFIGVLCLAIGALFDEALGDRPRVLHFGLAAVIILAALNVTWLSQNSSYISYLATDGYGAFLKENNNRLGEKAKALVFGSPILRFYAQEYGIPVSWDVKEMRWSTFADTPLPDDVKYVLMPEYVYRYMPPDQPMRRIVAQHWNVAWSFKVPHVWELRLYERPQVPAAP